MGKHYRDKASLTASHYRGRAAYAFVQDNSNSVNTPVRDLRLHISKGLLLTALETERSNHADNAEKTKERLLG